MIAAALNRMLGAMGGGVAAVRRRQVLEASVAYHSWSDDQLRNECRRRLTGEGPGSKGPSPLSLKDRLVSMLLERGEHRRAGTEDIPAFALAVECFARAPADLPAGSVLYPEQVAAAWALTGNHLVQMDTGEGKTYVILPTAFTLACSHPRVYIVCANDYLAWRDASRTRAFWNFVGAPPGLGLPTEREEEWSHRIVYTTLSALLIKSLNDELLTTPTPHPVIFGAVVLDEADSILLDQAHQPYTIVRSVKSRAFEWTFALEYARGLVEDVDVRVDRADLSATMTVEGSEKLRACLAAEGAQSGRLLLARYAVELAYIATRVATEGHDYVVADGGVHAVDRISGRVTRTMVPDWIIPLEFARGLPARPKTITLHRGSPLVLLERFAHLSGTSGTIVDDALEYLLAHRLLCVAIPPRFRRQGLLGGDKVFVDREVAHQYVCDLTRSALQDGRPVLIGTQSIADAEGIHQLLQKQPEPPPRLRMLTGLNERDAAGLFDQAGTVGSVLIATQFAGRGIDIRLSEEARTNGGMALICVGHAIDARHDRQFLGRVGRHGDPFAAIFVSSLDDRLMRMVTVKGLQSVINTMGGHDDPIEGSIVQRSLRIAQARMQRHVFLSRRYAMYRSETDAKIWAGIRTWFEYLQLPGTERSDYLSAEFVTHTVDHFVDVNLAPLLPDRSEVGREEAERVVEAIRSTLGLPNEDIPVSSLEIEGHVGEKAKEILRTRIGEVLQKPFGENARRIEEEGQRGWALLSIGVVCQQMIDGAIGDPADVDRQVTDATRFGPGPDVEDLALRVRDLASALAAAVPADRGPLMEELSRLYAEIEETRGRGLAGAWITNRTVRHIAYWSLLLEWTDFLSESERIEHRARQQGYSDLEFHRILTDRVLEQWAKNEAAISRRILFNLFRAGHLEHLDELFAIDDHREAAAERSVDRYEWVSSPAVDRAPRSTTTSVESLVRSFVAGVGHELRRPLTSSALSRVLADFLDDHPIHDLQTPDRIQRALTAWVDEAVVRGIGRQRREMDLAWLRRFLLSLRERRLIGPLPTLRHRVKLAARRYLESVSEPRTQAVAAGCLLFGALFVAVARWGAIVMPPPLGLWASYADALIFGGMLGAGNVLAAAMGPLIIGAAGIALLAPTGVRPLSGNAWDRFVVPILQALVAGWLSSRALDLLPALGVFVLMLGLATVTRIFVWTIQNHTGIDLDLPWLVYSVFFVFLPRAAEPGRVEASIAAVTVLTIAFVAWESLNVAELNVVSARIRGTALTESEEVATSWRIGAGAGAAPAVLATFATWVVVASAIPTTIGDGWSRDAAFLAGYFVVVAGWTGIVVRRRLAPTLWLHQLNSLRQVVVDAPDPPALERKLAMVRRRLLSRQLVFLLAILILTAWAFGGEWLPGTQLPLGLVLVAVATLLATIGKEFILQIYGFMFSRIPLRQRTLDVSALPEPEEDLTLWQRLEKRLGKRLGVTVTIVVAVYGGVKQLFDVIDLWGKVSALWSKTVMLLWP